MMSRMTNRGLMQTVKELHAHVLYRLAHDHDADEEQITHNFLAQLDLSPAERLAILDEYWRRAKLKQAL